MRGFAALFVFLTLFLAVLLFGYLAPACGNSVCETGEDVEGSTGYCPQDCQSGQNSTASLASVPSCENEGCAAGSGAGAKPSFSAALEGKGYYPDRIIVKFRSEALAGIPLGKKEAGGAEIKSSPSINSLNYKYRLIKMEKVFVEQEIGGKELKDMLDKRQERAPAGGIEKAEKLREGFSRTFLLTFPKGYDIESIVNDYKQDPGVEYAEPDYIVSVASIEFLDPSYFTTIVSLKKPPVCTPNCVGKVCGDDGCGGSCGTCSPGYACQDGACVASSCSDTDSGQDYYVSGTCADAGGSSTDYCIERGKNKGYLTEYYCSGTSCASKTYNCTCQDGACVVQPPPSCSDTDGGQDYYVSGTCADAGGSSTDYCIERGKNKGYLTEYYCSGTSCASRVYDCVSAGGTCFGGYCQLQCSNECSPSGAKTCSGNGYKTCGNYDSDSCLEWSSVITCLSGYTCVNGNCISSCTPDCSGKVCGDDGCGGSCGTCSIGETCQGGSCVPNQFPNDPFYHSSGSWGQAYDDQWDIKKINAPGAWGTTQGENVIVAVIDTGIDYTHPELQSNMWINTGEIPGNGVDDEGNGYVDDYYGYDFASYCFFGCSKDSNPMDEYGHGTHVSGTIAAVGNNALGIIGIAPQAKLMAVKGLDSSGSGAASGLAEAVRYAVDNGADITNNSWGGAFSSTVLEEAFDYAWSNGVVSIAAAGNSNLDMGSNVFTPANIESVIAVAAVTNLDKRTYFSNYGAKVEVSAPGGAENAWQTVSNSSSSNGSFARNSSKYPRANFNYNSATVPYNITVYTNKGPNNDDLNYWVYKVTWSSSGNRWLIDEIYSTGAIIGNSATAQYHVPTTITVSQTGDIMVGLRKKGLNNKYLDIDSVEAGGLVYEESEISLADFDNPGILSLRADGTDIYSASLSNPAYYNPPYPPGLMIVPEFDPNGILYRAQGTSMASPEATGVAALILSHYSNASNIFVRNALKHSADNIDSLNPGFEGMLGMGRVNAAMAVNVTMPSIEYPTAGQNVTGIVSVTGYAFGPEFKNYQLFYYPEGNSGAKTAINSVQTTPVSNGVLATWNVTSIPSGSYALRLELTKQDNTMISNEVNVLVNASTSTITVLKDGAPSVDASVEMRDVNGTLVENKKTDASGKVVFNTIGLAEANFVLPSSSIDVESGLMDVPANYSFHLVPSNILARKDGAPFSGVTITVYVDSKKLGGSVSTNSSGSAVIYLDSSKPANFRASASYTVPQESGVVAIPANHTFDFVTSTATVLSDGSPVQSITVNVYDLDGLKLTLRSTDSSGKAAFYSKAGLALKLSAKYHTMTLNSQISTPENYTFAFPRESTATLLKDDGAPIKYTFVEAWSPGNTAYEARASTDSAGIAHFAFPNGTSIYFKATYLGLALTSPASPTPYSTTIAFPEETTVYFTNAGAPIKYASVRVYDESGNPVRSSSTGSTGTAAFCFIGGSKIRLKALYGSVYYFSPIITTPSHITIETSDYSDINVSGTVKNEQGTPLSYAYVRAYSIPDKVLIKEVYTNSSGLYNLPMKGALSGTYDLNVSRGGYKNSVRQITVSQGNNYTENFVLTK